MEKLKFSHLEFDECKTKQHGCAHICINTFGSYTCTCHIGYELNSDGRRCDDACGGVLTDERGMIQSPSYPNRYPKSKSCVWRIRAPQQQTIVLSFTHFDLEGSNSACNYDVVMVFIGSDQNRKKIGNFCGSRIPEQITTESNEVTLEFHTDATVHKTGFQVNYFTDRDECMMNEHKCEQICINLIGRYKCDCNSGYELFDEYFCKESKSHASA